MYDVMKRRRPVVGGMGEAQHRDMYRKYVEHVLDMLWLLKNPVTGIKAKTGWYW